MTFHDAVSSSPKLIAHYQNGLGALGTDRARVATRSPKNILGSLNVESAQKETSHQQHTWDYGVGFGHQQSECIVWIEVHDANCFHVQIILDKLAALEKFLRDHAPLVAKLRFQRYVWLASKSVAIPPNSRERRRLDGRGVLLKSKQLVLESVI